MSGNIEQATVQWVKGLKFGVAFTHIHPLETDRLQQLLEALLGSGSYCGGSAGSLNIKPPAAKLIGVKCTASVNVMMRNPQLVPAPWIKIKNSGSSQKAGRQELFEQRK